MDEKYNEALERVRELALAGKISADDILNRFPELAESEDERIRKFLVELVSNDKANNYKALYVARGVRFDDVLAYLEKQKEQKPDEWSEKDEEMRQRVIDTLKTVLSIRDEDDPIFAGSEMVRWIKNLHPKPHWKPSKEQMEALLRAVDDLRGRPYWGYINEVVYDIRDKLM